MCGIAAELRFDGAPADSAALSRMAQAMAPRGPDGHGLWIQDGVGLAHQRLKIIDLSERGAQPMADPHLGLVVVFNGCIYNYRELRKELAGDGYSFVSTSDTEVLLKAYHRWGEGFVDRLMGMFAFVIVERESGRAILGRDRLGIKPLYVAEGAGGRRLRAASTLPALLAAGEVDTGLDPIALHHYLSWHAVVPAPHTMLRGVRKVAPGTLVVVEPDGTRRETRYWDPRYERNPEDSHLGAADWADAVHACLRQAVRRRMVADVPVGVLLSGGLDSSLIVGLLAEEGQTGLQTFSIGFPAVGGREGDEFAYSDLVAREFATEHRKLVIEPERLVPAVPAALAAMSEPMVSHDAVAFYLLSEEVSRHVKVVQSGQGADEVFAGYHWYPPLAEADGDAVEAYERAFFDRDHAGVLAALAAPLHVGDSISRDFVRAHFARAGAATALDRALRLDQQVMLVDDPVKRVDNMTMAHGLEARTPFLDHELVELAAACPPELKLAHDGKGVLKDAARGLVPDAVIDRPKGYFPVPALVQLEGPFLDLVRDALTTQRARDRELFAPGLIDELLAAPNEHRTPSGASQLWQLGALEIWLQARGL